MVLEVFSIFTVYPLISWLIADYFFELKTLVKWLNDDSLLSLRLLEAKQTWSVNAEMTPSWFILSKFSSLWSIRLVIFSRFVRLFFVSFSLNELFIVSFLRRITSFKCYFYLLFSSSKGYSCSTTSVFVSKVKDPAVFRPSLPLRLFWFLTYFLSFFLIDLAAWFFSFGSTFVID